MKKVRKSVLVLTLVILLGTYFPVVPSIEGEISDESCDYSLMAQTSEYPPFAPPASNASTLNSGSLFINGQEIFWRYFYPNTSVIQPKNFRFSFEIWWESPDPDIVIVVDLRENEGESNSTESFGTLLPYEKILETPEGEFIHYAVWLNSTYFFMNETWASFGNEYIDDENLNLTVGIQHYTYFPIFEYTVMRNASEPIIEFIHPNYDELENKLVLDWSNTSFQILISSLNYIKSVTFIITFLNQTTFELQDMIVWNMDVEQDPGTGALFVPSLITEKIYPDAGGPMDIDTDHPFPASLVVVDGYGYATSKSTSIYLEIPYTNTTTTTPTDGDWTIIMPIMGTVSVISLAAVALAVRRVRK